MENLITDKELQEMIEEVLKSFSIDTILEAPMGSTQQQPPVQRPVPKQSPVSRPVSTKVPTAPVKKDIQPTIKKPSSQTIPGPNDKEPPVKAKAYDSDRAKEKQKMNKMQYQIFNLKMRLGKLGLNDAVRRFVKSMHDFDINITKNSKDKNDIRSYLAPLQGNLVALKGALESLESEFDELEKMIDSEEVN